MVRDIEKLRSELSGSNSTKVEELLIAQIIICHLETKQAQGSLAERALASLPAQDLYWLKRAEVAERKYLTALRMLATLREHLPKGLAPLNSTKLFIPGLGRNSA